ncbi:MAG: DUF2231 domain-containing protein [Candidatus Marinimicrobia bacterium]|nr:DUF2231 domain-containing protein [Candidatus Neomarinimicrobiota bacterium]
MINIENLHRQMIHFPIALLTMSIVFDLLGLYLKKEQFFSTSWYTLLTGAFASVVAILSGFIADRVYGHMLNPFPIFKTHGMVQLIASVIFIGLCTWRYYGGSANYKPPVWYLIVGLFAVVLILYGGHLGGTLAGHV